MKLVYTLLSAFILLIMAMGCETVINPELENVEPVLNIDAWITAQPKEQIIKLTYTQPYFDKTTPVGVKAATVVVTNETDNRTFIFSEDGSTGIYKWTPSNSMDSIGTANDSFSLSVISGSEQFTSTSVMGRVPKIDSITFTLQPASGFFKEYYLGEFWARDLEGLGDTYWIKAWKNDTLLLRPSEINIAFDASFSESNFTDNITFISPIRQAISPFDFTDDGEFILPYSPGDSVYVEILSINKAAFNFLNEVKIQTDRPGGFGELFASPFANVRTNITNANPNGKKAVGFFNVGAVSGLGKKFEK